jgi:hypothetical protein
MGLSPIAICTYSRIDHLRKTIDALKQNTLAEESDLYIFSDAPKAGDEEKVRKIRAYIRTVDGFKKVHIIERTDNGRVKNCRGGLRALLEEYGKCIFMEDDNVTAKGFLLFMNKALDTYAGNKEIFAISGYAPPIDIPTDYSADAYLLRQFYGWGAGLWKDRFDLINYISHKELKELLADKDKIKKLNEASENILPMMIKETYGRIEALDVKAWYLQFTKNMYSLHPRQSLVQNIGHDGSGVYCGSNSKYKISLWDSVDFRLSKEISADERIINAYRRFTRPGFKGRSKNRIFRFSVRIGMYPFLSYIEDLLRK